MTYEVIARKYRPQTFDEVVGQGHVAETLKNAIKSERVAHAYLFAGPRGVGKTSMARILAKALDCDSGPTISPCGKCSNCRHIVAGQHVDVIEVDGASNRGIDEVRSIRDNTRLTPLAGRTKIYIIDEVHMLTPPAFNAILKTLEEPPPHVKFIFATTAPDKLPETVLSRCQRFDFRRISTADIAKRLREIASREKVEVTDDVLFFIAKNSAGGMRDAESLLDQAWASGRADMDSVCSLMGGVPASDLSSMIDWMIRGDAPSLIKYANTAYAAGKDLGFLIDQLMDYIRDMLMVRVCGGSDLVEEPQAIRNSIEQQSKAFSTEALVEMVQTLTEAMRRVKMTSNHLVHVEICLVRLCRLRDFVAKEDLQGRLQRIEKQALSISPSPPRPEVTAGADLIDETPQAAPHHATEDRLQRILALWPDVLQKVKGKSVMTHARLVEGKPSSLREGKLTIGFPVKMRYHREQLSSPEARSLVEKCVAEVCREQYQLEFAAVEGIEPPPERIETEAEVPEMQRRPSRKSRPDEAGALEPIVRRAIQVFDGRVVGMEG